MISTDHVKSQIARIKEFISYRDILSEDISKVNVAWHLDHSIKVINSIADTLRKSDPEDYGTDFNMSRKIVFAAGRFPRGKGRAPKIVQPPETIKTEDILEQIDEATSNLKALESLHRKANFHHRIFGILDLKNSIRFLEIHTNHHLLIIEDIIKSKVRE